MNTIFLDESGFTGSNLLDDEQPVFALASHCLPDSESHRMRETHFKGYSGKELKFSKLAKSPKTQRKVIEFLIDLKEPQGNTRVIFVHKPFALLCKYLDLVLEPSMRRSGCDFYEDGFNLALANSIWMVVPRVTGYAYFNSLLENVQAFLREPSSETFRDLRVILEQKTATHVSPDADAASQVLRYLYVPLRGLTEQDALNLSSSDLEFAFSMTIRMMHSWKEQHGIGSVLIHDATAAMSRRKDIWDALVSPTVPEETVGFDRRIVTFPIGVSRTDFESSESVIGLQIADLLAGAVARCMAAQIKPTIIPSGFQKELCDVIDGWNVVEQIWPDARVTPEALGTTGSHHNDGAQFFAGILDS